MFFLLVQWYIDEFQEIIHLDEHIFSAERPLGIETFCMMSKVKYFTNQGNTGIPLMSSLGSKCEQTRHIIVTQKSGSSFLSRILQCETETDVRSIIWED